MIRTLVIAAAVLIAAQSGASAYASSGHPVISRLGHGMGRGLHRLGRGLHNVGHRAGHASHAHAHHHHAR